MLVFLTVAPLLAIGIWFVVSESLIGRDWSESRARSGFWNSGKLERLEVSVTSSILLALSILIAFWERFNLLVLICFGIGIAFSVNYLNREKELAKKRKRQIDGELPIFIQYLALMISSGLSPLRAIEIFSNRNQQVEILSNDYSIIVEEMRYLIHGIQNGQTIIQGLEEFVRRTETPSSRRFANSMIIALDRGTPLVPVLTSLIRDSRVDSKNAMLRSAGKAEISLMIPIVFLLLPISVLFALFPSLSQLQIF
jgi:tight adherence protein C